MKNLSLKAKFFGLNAMFVGVNATVLVALILGASVEVVAILALISSIVSSTLCFLGFLDLLHVL